MSKRVINERSEVMLDILWSINWWAVLAIGITCGIVGYIIARIYTRRIQ